MVEQTPANAASVAKQERDWAVIAHLSALVFLWSVVGGMLGPFIVWLLRRDDMPFAAAQAREALNFQITCFILGVLFFPLIFVGIGIVLLCILGFADLVLTIVAAVKVSEGVAYRYPFNFRLIK